MILSTSGSAKAFVAYARQDKDYRDELIAQLSSLKRDGIIDVFYDGLIEPGQRWNDILQQQIRTSDIVIFLLTANLFASDYIMEIEVPLALERHDRGETVIIPVYTKTSRPTQDFRDLQIIPSLDTPIKNYTDPDKGWLEVVNAVERHATLILTKKQARCANISILLSAELKQTLPRVLQRASTAQLCSRTGMGWYRDFGTDIDSSKPIKFLFLNPQSNAFELDSRLQWNPAFGAKGARTLEERKTQAIDLYDNLIEKGHEVRVIDAIFPAVFWTINTRNGASDTTAFVEIPIWRSEYRSNIYITPQKNGHFETYDKVFSTLWEPAKPW